MTDPSKRARRAGTAVLTAALGLLLLGAFGSAHWNLLDPRTGEAAIAVPEIRAAAPSFGITDRTGKDAYLVDFRGKVVLVHFWATWCSACCAEIPWLDEIQQRYSEDGFTVLSVSLDEGGWKAVDPFVEAHGLQYPVFLGDRDDPSIQAISVVPTMFFVDRNGRVARQQAGPMSRSAIEQTLESLIAEHSL